MPIARMKAGTSYLRQGYHISSNHELKYTLRDEIPGFKADNLFWLHDYWEHFPPNMIQSQLSVSRMTTLSWSGEYLERYNMADCAAARYSRVWGAADAAAYFTQWQIIHLCKNAQPANILGCSVQWEDPAKNI